MTENERTDLGLTDAAGCSCCAGFAQSTPLFPAEGSRQAEFKVEGMTCSHCVASVTEELSALDGVQSVGVELNAGGVSTVTVSSTRALDPEHVRAAIGEAGYSLVDSAS